MPIQETEAVLIRSYPLSESSVIGVFYTRDFGKVRAVARGIRSTKSKFRGQLDLLNRGHLIYTEKANRELQIVRDFDLIDNFEQIKTDFDRFSYACYFAELIDAIESDGGENPEIFSLLMKTFCYFRMVGDLQLFARMFELHLLEITGYSPQFARCSDCGNVLTSQDSVLYYQDQTSEMVCAACVTPHLVQISRGSCELMKRLQRSNFDQLVRIRASRQNYREMKFVLSALINYHTQRRLKSLKFLDLVEKS